MKNHRMQKIVSALRAIAASVLTVLVLAGCDSRRDFRVPLQSSGDEDISADESVSLDDRLVGRVVRIENAGNATTAIIRITDHSGLNSIRAGIERISPGGMMLSSVHATGAPLPAGSPIPTRTAPGRIAASLSENIEKQCWKIRDFLDRPGAAIAAAGLGLLIVIGLLRAVFRKVFCLVLVTAAVGTTAYAADTEYSLNFLRQERLMAQRLYEHAEQASGTANRLIEAGLVREAADQLVQVNFDLDVASVILSGHFNRIARLKSSAFRYNSSEEQRKLVSEYNSLTQRLQECQKQASTLHRLVVNANEKEASALQIYLAQQDRYRQRIQMDGLTDGKAVLNEVHQLIRFGLPLIRAGLVTSENASLCKLNDDGSLSLPNGLIVSLDGKPLPVPPTIVTNVVVRTNLVTAPAPPPLKIVEYRTNRVFVVRTNVLVVTVTNSPVVIAAGIGLGVTGGTSTKNTNIAVQMSATVPPVTAVTSEKNIGSNNATSAATILTRAASKSRLPMALALVGACVVMAVILAGFAWLAALRGRIYSMSFATETGETRTEELAALEDVLLLLGSSITRDHASVVDPSPRIAIGWRGPVLRSGTCGSVAVNDAPVLRTRRLLTGDRIAVTDNNGQISQLTFLACEPVELVVAGETITSQP